jgi:hypothetical protein
VQGQVLGVNSFYYPAFMLGSFFLIFTQQFTFSVALVQFGAFWLSRALTSSHGGR